MCVLGGNPSTQMYGLGSSFQSEEINSMVAEAMEEFVLASAEGYCEDPWRQIIMVFMASGAEYHEAINASHWLD